MIGVILRSVGGILVGFNLVTLFHASVPAGIAMTIGVVMTIIGSGIEDYDR